MFEFVDRAPAPGLRGLVRRYSGFAEEGPGPVCRREVPGGDVVVIVDLGEGWELPDRGARHGSFVAGLDDHAERVGHPGRAHGVQLDLTPFGAPALLGVPSGELAGELVGLDALLGPEAGRLAEALHALPSWEARFELLDERLGARAAGAASPRPDVAWAWQRLEAARGRVPVARVAAELGCSRRHLSVRFREEVGLPPKRFARLLRFRSAVELLGRVELAQVALLCGYADQAHLTRDVRALAGMTPSELVAQRSPLFKTPAEVPA